MPEGYCCVCEDRKVGRSMKEVRICSALFFLVIWSLILCSCGQYELEPDQPQSNHPNKPGSGDIGYY